MKPIHKFTSEEQHELGDCRYATHLQYKVTKIDSEERTMIDIQLVELEEPYHKAYTASEDDWELYSRIAPQGYSLGAYIGTSLVGVVIAEEVKWNNTVLIWHFQVAEDYRRMSVGRQLMEELVRLAEGNGIRAINLETQNTNVNAIRFYRKCGFEIEGIDLSYYTNDDVFDGEVAIFMKRKIKIRATGQGLM
ncbi:GNAT family N-acetyltransferase [Paenibacillus campinasensis]|nr:GNAT family N-acetyltransferase [Paenibacillus campinasensis]